MRVRTVRYAVALLSAVSLLATSSFSAQPVWSVAYEGEVKGRRTHTVTHAAELLSRYMGKVLGTEVKTVPWQKAEGAHLFLLTDASRAPASIARELDGKRGDAFLVRYPYQLDGKTVCLLLSHDSHGYDFPVYHFLRQFMRVDWVGPGEIGEVVPPDPDWRLPREISILEDPDFEMRHWGDFAFQHARPLLAGSPRMDFHPMLTPDPGVISRTYDK